MRADVALVLALAGFLAHAQNQSFSARSKSSPPAVVFVSPEQIIVPAGKATTVALHFRIAPGLHINSHTPSEEELIPTALAMTEGSGVRLVSADYPPGAEYTLPIDPSTKLNVYTGEFIIEARITTRPGEHLVEARLRYQACDNNACMPPKTLIAAIDVIGK